MLLLEAIAAAVAVFVTILVRVVVDMASAMMVRWDIRTETVKLIFEPDASVCGSRDKRHHQVHVKQFVPQVSVSWNEYLSSSVPTL